MYSEVLPGFGDTSMFRLSFVVCRLYEILTGNKAVPERIIFDLLSRALNSEPGWVSILVDVQHSYNIYWVSQISRGLKNGKPQ